MSEDQGATKGQDKSDATVKPGAAVPATPAALSDKELEKVAGGARVAGPGSTNISSPAFQASNTFFKPNK
jgi:hypothetical protein